MENQIRQRYSNPFEIHESYLRIFAINQISLYNLHSYKYIQFSIQYAAR